MKLVCMGDSLTYGYNVAAQHGWVPQVAARLEIDVVNQGVCGDTTMEMRGRFARDVLDEEPDWLFLMGGANDILLDVPLGVTELNMQTMLDMAEEHGIPAIIGIPPLTKPESAMYGWQSAEDVDQHNQILTAYRQHLLTDCSKRSIPVIDFMQAIAQAEKQGITGLYADGVHPTVQGYSIFAQSAFDVLNTIIYNKG